MYRRNILKELDIWKSKANRKPLIIRGARQTGKTVAVNMFAEQFGNFISLNLERERERNLFEQSESVEQLIQSIEIATGKSLQLPDTLLFIDEIQNSEKAIKFLRFFYEDRPELAVVAAGSLLEAIMKKEGFSFPVGRVEFLYLYPVTFDEFLLATGSEKLFKSLSEASIRGKLNPNLHKLASEAFTQYVFVGGMPAAVSDFIETKSFKSSANLKEDIITAVKDDVAKYSGLAESKYVRHVIEYAPYHVGERIKYEKFGQSQFRSREIKNAFDILEYSMVVQRVYGSYVTALPLEPNFKVSPKIIFLDSGLMANRLGLTEEMIVADLNDVFRGSLAEQIVGQSFLAMDRHRRITPCFWYRNSPGSTAETDYLVQHRDLLIPVEVKSGKSGRLKSLLQFVSVSTSDLAVRLHSGELNVETTGVQGKRFKLLNVPFYLQWRLADLIEEVLKDEK